MKYSKENERDYNFYFNNRSHFIFAGTFEPKHKAIFSETGVDAKQAFFSIDNNGKNIPTREPELLNELLLCKASVNFNIKMWAESRADGTLPLILFSKRKVRELYNNDDDCGMDIETEFNLPSWVIEAVENQKGKYYENKITKR